MDYQWRSFESLFLLERRVWHPSLGNTGQARWGPRGAGAGSAKHQVWSLLPAARL